MQQSDHPEHNMPVTYQDVSTQGASLIDRFMGPRQSQINKKRQNKDKMSGGDSAVSEGDDA